MLLMRNWQGSIPNFVERGALERNNGKLNGIFEIKLYFLIETNKILQFNFHIRNLKNCTK